MSSPVLAEASPAVVPDRVTPRRSRARASRRWRRTVSPVVLVLAWEAAARTGLLAPEKLPAPSAVLATGWRLASDGTLGVHLLDSLTRAALGLLIGGGLALVLGAAAGCCASAMTWSTRRCRWPGCCRTWAWSRC